MSSRSGGGTALPPARVAIALGSNVGDRQAHLAFGVAALARLLHGLRVSTIHETAPVGVSDDQGPFLNAAAVGTTTLTPGALLAALLDIERTRGRLRPRAGAARTLDLDLILYADRIVEDAGLQVPHPRFRERAFVLDPLSEIASDWIDPVSGETVEALRARLR